MALLRNVRLRTLVLIIVVLVLLGAGAITLRRWQRNRQIEAALVEGRAAWDRQDWPSAARLLGRYVGRNIDRCADPEVAAICRQFAEAQLSIQPPQGSTIGAAISMYRRLLRDGEFDISDCARLAFLYQATGDPIELQYTADRLAEHFATDPRVVLWRAQAAIGRQDADAARVELEALIRKLEDDAARKAEYVQACVLIASLDRSDRSGRGRKWLDRAIARDPSSADPRLARARLLRSQAQFQPPLRRAELLAASQEDLVIGMNAPQASALTRLGLSEELRLCGLLDQAESQLAIAGNLSTEQVRECYLDLTDWRVDCGTQSLRIKTARNKIDDAASEAHALLAGLSAPHGRVGLLPMAVELSAASGRIAEAREQLDEFFKLVPLIDPQSDAKRASLEAIVLLAEGLPYRVIDRLEPFYRSSNFNDAMRGLLAEAFRRTGQLSRIAAIYHSDAAGAIVGPIPDLVAIEAMLSGGEVEKAARALGNLEKRNPGNVELRLLRIDIDLLVAGDGSDAPSVATRKACESQLRELLRTQTTVQDARSKLAFLLAGSGRADEGEQLLMQAVTDYPDSQEAMLNLARFYVECNKRQDAVATLRSAIDHFPTFPQPRLELADLLMRGQDREAARQVLVTALDAVTHDDRPEITRRLAAVELTDDATRDLGIARLRGLAEADPQEIEARSLLLQSSAFRRDRQVAQQLIDQIKAVEGESGQRWRLYQAQLALDELKDTGADQQPLCDRIDDWLNTCIRRDPGWSQPVLLLGSFYERRGQVDEAERLYRRSLDTCPDSAVAGQLLLQLENTHRFKDALNVMDRYPAVFDAPEFGARRLTIALDSGDSDIISRQLELQSGMNARDPQILILSAMLTYSRNRDVEESQRILRDALKAGADPLAVYTTQIGILKSAGRVDEARQILDNMVAETPSYDARLLRGAFLDSIGDVSAAETDYRELPRLSSDERGYAHLTDFYAEKARFADAIAAIESGLEKFSQAMDLKRGLLKILLTRQNSDDLIRAEALLGTIPSDQMDTDLIWVQTVLAEHQGGADTAQRVHLLLDRAARNPKASLEVYQGLITIALRFGETAVVDKLLNSAGREHGENQPALFVLRAQLMVARGEVLLALGYLRQAIIRNGNDPSAYERLLALAPQLGDSVALGEFTQPLERAMARAPTDERLQIAHARLLQHQNRSDEGAEQLATWFRPRTPGPGDATILLTLVDLYTSAGKLKNAEEYLERLVTNSPNSPAVRAARMNLLASQARFEEIHKLGIEVLGDKTLGDLEKQNLALRAAQLLAGTEDSTRLKLAQDVFERIISTAPKFVPARLGLAMCYGQLGKVDDALQAYRSVLEYDPNRDEALNNLAWLLTTEKNNPAQAVEYAVRAVDQKPEEPAYRDTLGEILQRLPDRLPDAAEQFTRASELYGPSDPKRARSLLKLAVVCHRLQRDEEAVRYLEAAKRIDAAGRIGSSSGALDESDRAKLEQLLKDLTTKPARPPESTGRAT